MAQTLPELPLELLLDILEWLLVLGGKANQRSAAYLAQSCRLLRTSEAGKRARYIHALARHSLSVPKRLPENLAYEAEVLETASWPPRAPSRQTVGPDAEGVPDLYDSLMGVDGYIGLSQDRKSLICLERLPEPSFSASASPRKQAIWREGSVLRRTIPLRSKVSKWMSDRQGTYCAVLYEMTSETEIIEVWDPQTGACQGTLTLNASEGLAAYGEIRYIAINERYLLIEREATAEVREFPTDISNGSTFPVVWGFTPHNGWSALSATLLSPRFVALMTRWSDDSSSGHVDAIQIYCLGQDSAFPKATFYMPVSTIGPIHHLSAGADIVPDGQGIVVISMSGSTYLLSISTLADILYSDAKEARVFQKSWVKLHMKSVKTFADDRNEIWPYASGWRCVLHFSERRGCDNKKGRAIVFIDASPRRCQARGEHSHLSASCGLRIYEHRLDRYLPSTVNADEVDIMVQLLGGRLVLYLNDDAAVAWRL